jgi:hypothetical protein
MKKTIIQLVLSVVILLLVYFVYESVMAPVRFNKEYDYRSKKVIEKMKQVRSAQLLYKQVHGTFAPSFDTLVDFLQYGEIPVVKMVPDPEDTTFTRSILDTIAFISVGDSVLGAGKDPQTIRYIPFTDKEEITLNAGTIERSNITVPVFEAIAPKEKYLSGLDDHLIRQDRYKSVTLGSMTEPSSDGNWE